MKKMMTGVVATAMLVAGVAVAADVDLTVDVASAYVFRGDTLNDGPVVQPGLEVALPHGFALGVWGNIDIDDYDGALEEGQFSEIDVYVSYALPFELLDISIGYTEYTYPSGGGDADREVDIKFGYKVGPVDVGFGVFYGVDGGIEKSLYAELSLGSSYDVGAVTVDVGATAGYLDPDEGESGFSGYSLSAGVSYGILGAKVTYYGQIDDEVLVDVGDGGTYDVEVVGMLSLALSF
ncbi:MAG: TorF family putative porin [Kiritimatiellia bacterium]